MPKKSNDKLPLRYRIKRHVFVNLDLYIIVIVGLLVAGVLAIVTE